MQDSRGTSFAWGRKIHVSTEHHNSSKKHKIPEKLILNYDQTPLSYVCSSNTTLEVRGSKANNWYLHSECRWRLLPMQLIYAGKTDRCHPNGINFPEGFNITHTSNHCSCEKSANEHLEKVVFRYLSMKREHLKMSKGLLIFDVFKGETTQQVKDVILANNCMSLCWKTSQITFNHWSLT